MPTLDYKMLFALTGMTVAHVITALTAAPPALFLATTAGLLGVLIWTGWSIWHRSHSVNDHEATLQKNRELLDELGVSATSEMGEVRGDVDRVTALVREAAEEVSAAGTRLVTIVSDLPHPAREAYVGLDNARAGRTAAWFLQKWLGLRDRARILVPIRNDRFRGEEVFDTLGLNVKECAEWVDHSPVMTQFRSHLFSRIVPIVKDIGLWGDKVQKAFERQQIEIAPLAFMRGRTLNHAFVILDEAQNTTPEQMKMFLTRIGFGSKAVVTGDVSQIDLPRTQLSGLIDAERVLKRVQGIAITRLSSADVVRHPLVARIVDAYDARSPGPDDAPPVKRPRRSAAA